MTLSDLRATAAARGPAGTLAAIAALEDDLAGLDNPLELSRRLTEALADAARVTGPTVIVGFAGLHYPPSRLDPARPKDAALRAAIETARAALAGEPGAATTWRPHFQGISDMSFLGLATQLTDDALVRENTPAARLIDRAPEAALAFPVVNIGPWGREFHQRLERVHAPYAFDVLPRLLARTIDALLSGNG
jgi:arginine utilization protein RocB